MFQVTVSAYACQYGVEECIEMAKAKMAEVYEQCKDNDLSSDCNT